MKNMELKEKLVALRKEKGLTQSAVAEKLDVSRQAISRWESGVALPSTDNLKCLGALCGVPVDYLINEETEWVNSESDNKKENEDRRNHKKLSRGIVACISVVLIVIVVSCIAIFLREETETIPIENYCSNYYGTNPLYSCLCKQCRSNFSKNSLCVKYQ